MILSYVTVEYAKKLMKGSHTCPAPVVRMYQIWITHLHIRVQAAWLGFAFSTPMQHSTLKVFSSPRPSSSSKLKMHLKKVIFFLQVLRNVSTLISAKTKHTGRKPTKSAFSFLGDGPHSFCFLPVKWYQTRHIG